MVYQTMEASHYLEGNVAATLRLLTEALRKLGLDATKVAERKARWKGERFVEMPNDMNGILGCIE